MPVIINAGSGCPKSCCALSQPLRTPTPGSHRTIAGEMGAVDGRSSALDFAVDACNRVAAALGISSGAVSSAAA